MVQMARVLGMHTVAKRVDSDTEQEWLNALGVDFIQSNSQAAPVAIESLERRATPARQEPV
jgi:EAL domain-containing protein (putative c-di-GMP-specific phosphodiesterase class I)